MTALHRRRRFLAATGSAALGGLAGCLSSPLPLLSPVSERWRTPLSGDFLNEPLVERDGTLYATASGGDLSAVAADSGEVRWSVTVAERPTVGPALDERGAYAGQYALTAVAPGGGVRWKQSLEVNETAEMTTTPVVRGDRVFVGTDRGDILRLDAASGDVRRRTPVVGDTVTAIAVTGGRVYASTIEHGGHGHVVALNGATESVEWTREFDNRPRLTVADGTVYVRVHVHRGGIVALDAASGDVRWRLGRRDARAVTVVRDTAYVASGIEVGTSSTRRVEGALIAVDVATGEHRWRVRTDDYGRFPPTVANGRVYVSSEVGGVVAAYTTDGEYGWTYDVGEGLPTTSPAYRDGTLYLGVDGDLVALEPR